MSSSGPSRDAALLTAGYSTGLPCVRSLGRRGVHTVVASEREGVPEFDSRYCGEAVRVPDPSEDFLAYRDAMLDLAARPDVRTAVPTREEDVYLYARYRDRFERHLDLVVPDIDDLERIHDRLLLYEAALEAGVPVPETRLLDEVDDWGPAQVVKSRYNLLADYYLPDRSPRDVEMVKEVKHLSPGEAPDVEALREEMHHTPIVQEFVPRAGEYMVAALYDRGEPLAFFQHRQIRGESYLGGGGVYRKSVRLPELDSLARRLLAELECHGLACIEYMEHAETGEFVLTEINPRMWQSLGATVRMGADFPTHYWLCATGRADEIDPDYDVGVGSHLLRGEFNYLSSVLREESPLVDRPSLPGAFWAVFGSMLTNPRFDHLYLDDPRPFLHHVRAAVPVGN